MGIRDVGEKCYVWEFRKDLYLSSGVAGRLAECLVAVDDGEVDDLRVGQDEAAVG